MKHWIFLLLLHTFSWSFGQYVDSFSDGNIYKNPQWQGDTADFRITPQKQLQLDAPGWKREAFLYLSHQKITQIEWQFWVKLDFSPSNNNLLRFYLYADTTPDQDIIDGYYIRIGENGSDDGVDLFRQDGKQDTKLIDGRPGLASKSSNTLRIRVRRDGKGQWKLWTDSLGNRKFYLQGKAFDTTHSLSAYSGIFCKFTKTRADAFYFDDIYAGPYLVDTVPPKLNRLEVTDPTSLHLYFNEMPDSSAARDTNRFNLLPGGIKPVRSIFTINAPKRIRLVFNSPFQNKTHYRLYFYKLPDHKGNYKNLDSTSFLYFIPGENDVLINEFMADPTPPNALPKEEFTELYNTTNYPVALKNWKLADATGAATIPNDTLAPGDFLILCPAEVGSKFNKYGKTLGIKDFPSLNNSGDVLYLKDPGGNTINKVTYDKSWYHDKNKADGGWSIERINPFHPCSDLENWRASTNPSGGTPGARNSVYDATPDTIPPEIEQVEVKDSLTLRLTFTEVPDSQSVLNANWKIIPGATPDMIIPKDSQAYLYFNKPLTPNIAYTIKCTGLKDCWGNRSTGHSLTFIYWAPQPAQPYQVMITEILPDPFPAMKLPEAEFIELRNTGDMPVNLKSWTLSDTRSTAVFPEKILPPDSFLILTTHTGMKDYKTFGNTLALQNFPSLNNEGDSLVLKDPLNHVIFFLPYRRSWYDDAIKAEGGWTIEMVDVNNPCGRNANWNPSENPAGGTPGTVNSVSVHNPDETPPSLKRIAVIDPKTLKVFFSEAMESNSFARESSFRVIPGELVPVKIIPEAPAFQSWLLVFENAFAPNRKYTLEFQKASNSPIPADCSGNRLPVTETAQFGIPSKAEKADLVINEILFNPFPGGSDFVELFNRSKKIIELSSLYLAGKHEQEKLKDPVRLTKKNHLLFPGKYVAFSEDTGNILKIYRVPHPELLIPVNDLPTWPDDSGRVVLADREGNIIDHVGYKEEWHFPIMDNPEGVSLERLVPSVPSNNPDNWHSAASTAGYATPTSKNSQAGDHSAAKQPFSLASKIFSPDQDGYQDFLKILYRFEKPGTVVNITIFDLKGREIIRLVRNSLAGKEGFYTWDGTTRESRKAPVGVYVLLLETHHPDGSSSRQKLSCTLAGKF